MNEELAGRRLAVYAGGSVAAYRTADVITALRRLGAEVRVAMTEGAQHFVTATTLQALSGHAVMTSTWAATGAEHGMEHLELSSWCEAQIAVAAPANLLARLALGLADDAVTTTALACRAPLIIAPAMETAMWEHPATRAHVETLRGRGVRFVGPVPGRLASGREGMGRLARADDIVQAVGVVLGSAAGWLRGHRVVVTAGGTRERIDAVRYLSNHSSGRMGNAIAVALLEVGAEVVLITTAPPPLLRPGLTVVSVESAEEMHVAVRERLRDAGALIMAAAVADRRPAHAQARKVPKVELPATIEVVPTVDILTALRDDPLRAGRLFVGFAAETDDLLKRARRKLAGKGLDLIVANDVGAPGVGMGAQDNAVTVIGPDGVVAEIERAPKLEVARQLVAVLRPWLLEPGVAR